MSTQYRLQIEIVEASPPAGTCALLVPVPPTTPHQTLISMKLDSSWSISPVKESTGVQHAILGDVPAGAHMKPIAYELSDSGSLVLDHLTKLQHVGSISADVHELAEDIGLQDDECEPARVRKIVDSLASKFWYRSGFTNDTPLTCDVLTGNCLSINEAFLKLAKVAGVPAAYYIGYFFEYDQPLKSKDWHCWVSTLSGQGFESWDIAHHLKRGLRTVQPALNPVPGTRFAMCVGRNLTFRLPVGDITVPHLCEPRWVLGDCTSKPCEIVISLRALTESCCDKAALPVRASYDANRDIQEFSA
ncbi:transglutaminase domain-containing protein [Herbaspirillum sp. HC18]|nr:transglutaminase domain-containing protein [Herbaspirillum sp. HC18]